MSAGRTRRLDILLGTVLVFMVASSFWQIPFCDFIMYDDPVYVTLNENVNQGWTLAGVRWAFTYVDTNWHPLTWLSHMLDCQFFGLNPSAHHVVNVLFHIINSLLLYCFLRGTTGTVWRSFLVAALFAIHPLHVQSVAWISERKDVLSTCFWLCTMIFYGRYVRGGTTAGKYLGVLFFYALGCMSKPMVVTLPFVLLLMDYWPLKRKGEWAKCVLEKIPLFVMSLIMAIVTLHAQHCGNAISSWEVLPWFFRLHNALVSYVVYIIKTFWPVNLAFFYSHFGSQTQSWEVVASVIVLAGISVTALWQRVRRPWFLVGWLWYLGTLVPVIGLIQVGGQGLADRYTYVPLIGLFVAAAWGFAELVDKLHLFRRMLIFIAGILLMILMIVTSVQAGYWRDAVTVFQRALEVTRPNSMLYIMGGNAFMGQEMYDEAIRQYQKALQVVPDSAGAHYNIGNALAGIGKFEEAEKYYRLAIRLEPGKADYYNNLGVTLVRQDKIAQGVACYREVLRLEPSYQKALNNLHLAWERQCENSQPGVARKRAYEAAMDRGIGFMRQGLHKQALEQFSAALREDASQPIVHYNLAVVLAKTGKLQDAKRHFAEALRIQPDFAQAREGFGIVDDMLSDASRPNRREETPSRPTPPIP